MNGLIVGCGYLGQRVARLLLANGHNLHALTRSEQNAVKLEDEGIHPIVGDVMLPEPLSFPEVDFVVHAIGLDRKAGYSKRQVYVDGLKHVLAKLSSDVRIVYVSSTSVYGQSSGEWVCESSETEPSSESGKVCLEAERLVREWGSDSVVVRLAGIYGPNRLLRSITALKSGDAIAGNADAWLNLIHVDDAAALVSLVTTADEPQPLILGCDGQPCPRGEYYAELARLAEAGPPTFDPTLTSRSGGSGHGKRCRSEILDGLAGYSARYPSFVEGLAHAVGD